MKDLVQIIKDNPGCIATIDNDCWWLRKAYPRPEEEMTEEEHEDWLDTSQLASDGEVKNLGDGGYGSGHLYDGDILQALAQIVGVKIESV